MPKAYTSQELQAAVAKLIRTSIRRQVGALGNRKTSITFSDVHDASVGVFVTEPKAPYYVVRLGVEVLTELVESSTITLEDLVDSIRATARWVRPVTELSPLANARTALRVLSSATSVRTTGLTDIEAVPAFRRFDSATSRFLDESGRNIRSGGEIVQTPEEARARLAEIVDQLLAEHTELIRRAALLAHALEDFENMGLPARFSNSIIQNALTTLEGHYDELEAETPAERLGLLRGVVLDVLAARAAVRGFGSLRTTPTFLYFTGVGGPYADASHPAVPAQLLANLPGPHTIVNAETLDVIVDSTYGMSLLLPESYAASIETLVPEPYTFSDTPGAENNEFALSVQGYPDVVASFPSGSGPASNLVTVINAALTTQPVIAEAVGQRLYLQGEPADMVANPDHSQVFTRHSGNWGGVDVQLGDWLQVTDAANPENVGWYNVADITGLPTSFKVYRELGLPVSESGGTLVVSLNKSGRGVRVRYTDAYKATAVINRESLTLLTGSNSIRQRTCMTLGLPYDMRVQCEPTRVEDIAVFINSNPIIAPGGVARLQASAVFAPSLIGAARSEPTDSTLVVFSNQVVVCDITNTGSSITFENFVYDPTAQAGDIIVIRKTTGEVDNWGVVVSNSGSIVVADMNHALSFAEPGVEVEFGPDLRSYKFPAKLVLANETVTVNQGIYEVLGLDGTQTLIDSSRPPVAVVLARPLIQHSSLGYQPVTMDAQLGSDYLRIQSQSILLNTKLELAEPTDWDLFWSAVPAADVGETEWFGLPSAPLGVGEGDILELHDTGAEAPTYSIEVEDTGSSPNILQLVTLLPTNVGTWSMTQNSPAPYGRVRVRKKDNYDAMSEELELWLTKPKNSLQRYYGQLRRLINPLIVNKNPKASDVNSALLHVQELQTEYTSLSLILSLYQAEQVESVDTLIDTYLQQGGRRAVDVLVEGSFSAFFGLNQDEVSYAGDLQQAVREVTMNDMPVRKTGNRMQPQVIESYEETDYEYTVDDVEDDVPIPGDQYDYENSAF